MFKNYREIPEKEQRTQLKLQHKDLEKHLTLRASFRKTRTLRSLGKNNYEKPKGPAYTHIIVLSESNLVRRSWARLQLLAHNNPRKRKYPKDKITKAKIQTMLHKSSFRHYRENLSISIKKGNYPLLLMADELK
ncbi:hypothetical protein C6H88_01285 [Chlamydia muridarum str. Nigg]|uniref:Uncharacterized protein n=1 Tax=Chlamydia muridarum (strain MoPn / Nigg) TaxID=243161 RepID=Q9PL62_CHLMU|nr:hypothetical protein TC_0246 [Chlamydia muridarum str. Nigg]AIT91080.1 hypothetical protein NC80_01225 [Chlamydia muridarum]UFX61796.1 hypothetical protein FTM42_01375 [Chlamydia trachomatis]AIT91974.1 hypothetical protein NC81_01240 [Chlamydia muridarum]AIW23850.1 hypothetical protein DNC_01240 [Chlamydia muridarum]